MIPNPSSDASEVASSNPDRSVLEGRKRKRDVLACLACRRRKLKCDRGLPACSRCQKGGVASSCTYQSFPVDGAGHQDEFDEPIDENGAAPKRARGSSSVNPPNGLIDREVPSISTPTYSAQTEAITRLEDRLKILEGIIAQGASRNVAAKEAVFPMRTMIPKEKDEKAREPETSYFKGRGFRTQFYGPSCPISLIAHFPEVRAMMKEAHPGSALERLQNDCKVMQARYKKNEAKSWKEPPPDLVDCVPEKTVTDSFVKLYFNTFEKTYHILHEPTFWSDYDEFWKSPRDSKPGFVPVLLLILATVRDMSPGEPLSFDLNGSSSRRTEAISWIQACDAWLKQQSQKHRFMAMYQVMCLRVLAASSNCLKMKEAYLGVENLLGYFKAAGMHRDPSILEGRCSVFEKEMRRRFWATAMELELQASIDRGMSSSLSSIPFDCQPPLNINDEDLAVDALHCPEPKPLEQYTLTSYLHVSHKSLPLRVSLCSLINDPSSHLEYHQVLQYEQQINEALDAIPQWTDWTNKGHNQASSLLDLQLRQFLLMLHTPFARRSGSSQHRYSRMVCFETSKHLLDQHSKLISSGNFTLPLLREDVFRAALSICHNTFLYTLKPDVFFHGIISAFPSMLEDAFKILEERSMRRGRGYHQFWYISVAFWLVQSKLDPENASDFKLQAMERVARLYHKALAHMEAPPTTHLPPLEAGFQAPGSWFSNPDITGFTLGETDDPVGVLDPFDASDWTLDNLWSMEGDFDTSALG